MALGILNLIFIRIGIISVLGIALLYLTKNKEFNKVLFYFLAIWAMLIAIMRATSLPSNYIMQQIIALGIGFFSVIGIVVYIKADASKTYQIARGLVTASVVIGVINLFFF